jgi:hypothetical protein
MPTIYLRPFGDVKHYFIGPWEESRQNKSYFSRKLLQPFQVGLDEAKPENLKAMFDFTREYGIYRESMTHIADTRE